MVEYVDECRVALAVHLAQLNAYEAHLAEHVRAEKEACGVEGVEHLALVFLDDWLKLVDVAYEQELLAAEWLAHVARVYAKHLVDEVDDVGAHHADFVNHDKLYLAQDFPFLGCVFQCAAYVARRVAGVVWQQRVEGQLEEAVQGRAAGVDGRYACRGEYDMFFLRVGADVAHES